jgi:hypothetical protein
VFCHLYPSNRIEKVLAKTAAEKLFETGKVEVLKKIKNYE